MSFLMPSQPSAPAIPPLPPAPPPPPQMPNQAIGDSVAQQQQQAQGARGTSSTVLTGPQGVTSPGPAAGPGLAAVMPAGAAASLIGGPSINSDQNRSMLG